MDNTTLLIIVIVLILLLGGGGWYGTGTLVLIRPGSRRTMRQVPLFSDLLAFQLAIGEPHLLARS